MPIDSNHGIYRDHERLKTAAVQHPLLNPIPPGRLLRCRPRAGAIGVAAFGLGNSVIF